jgi:hypothetical protein
MGLDLAIFIGVPSAIALLALRYGVDTRDGDDWNVHTRL